MDKILIVGGLGFLGSKLAQKIIDENKFELYIYDIISNQNLEKNFNKKTHIFYESKISLKELIQNNHFYFIINAAVVYDAENIYKIYETNFILPLKLINYCKNKSDTNFIFFDTFFSKFEYNKKVNYTRSKKYFLKELHDMSGIKSIVFQLEHMYGPGDSQTKFVEFIKNSILNDEKEIKLTECIQKRDFIHVDDVCELIMESINKINFFDFLTYNIQVGQGYSISIKEFVNLMKAIKKSSIKLLYGSVEMNPKEIMDSKADIDSIPKFLKWKPKINLQKGIKNLYNI